MKVKLFTHDDLDGVACGILGKLAFGNNIDIEYCNYENINNRVQNFLAGNCLEYDRVFITDILVNEDIANEIDRILPHRAVLLDHHPTATWLNKYRWAQVVVDYDGYKTCGAQLFYHHLLENRMQCDKTILSIPVVINFVALVRSYDTWLWAIDNYLKPKQLNDLLYIYGRDNFIEWVIEKIKSGHFEFSDTDNLLLKLEQEKIDRYVEDKNKKLIVKDMLGYKAGIVFAEQYHSELGNKLSKLHPELDFIVIINIDKSVSYRTIKDNINLGTEIAKIYGGGGHPKAAGSPISDEIRDKIIDLIFNK